MAIRVAKVPADEFDRQVEGANPPTVATLAEARLISVQCVDYVCQLACKCDAEQRQKADHWIDAGQIPDVADDDDKPDETEGGHQHASDHGAAKHYGNEYEYENRNLHRIQSRISRRDTGIRASALRQGLEPRLPRTIGDPALSITVIVSGLMLR